MPPFTSIEIYLYSIVQITSSSLVHEIIIRIETTINIKKETSFIF